MSSDDKYLRVDFDHPSSTSSTEDDLAKSLI